MKRAFVIGGPTGAGKSALAIQVARAVGAVVLSADAMQVYRGMDVGTGKVRSEEMEGVAHFGLDLRDPDEPFDVADFLEKADRVLAEHPRVIVAGGTSLYLRALRRGLVQTPTPDPERRAALEQADDLHARLERVDPELAARLHPNDHVRLIRGIEVFEDLGVKLSVLQAEHAARPDRVHVRGVWVDREDLDARIDARVLQMMEDGYLAEVERLLESFDRSLKPMRSLGYRHLADHVLDGLDLDEAVRRTQRDSRRFARKQRTWRRHLGLDGQQDTAEAVRLARELFG